MKTKNNKWQRKAKPTEPRLVGTPLDAIIAAYDQAVVGYESKWGADTLPGLVDAALAEKFEIAKLALDEAITSNEPEATRMAASKMLAGWKALDAAATKNGFSPAGVKCFKGFAGGVVYTICETREDASMYVACYPHHASATVSADEVAQMLRAASVMNNRGELVQGPLDKLLDMRFGSLASDGAGVPNDAIPF
mgnify:CR=1 FL=1